MCKATMILAVLVWLGGGLCLAVGLDQGAKVQHYLSMLKDPSSDVRRQGIQGLRKLSSRIHRSGDMRIVRPPDYSAKEAERLVRMQLVDGRRGVQAKAERADRIGRKVPLAGGPDFAPQVEGLVPHLIVAANDPDEGNRILALYALADTHDPLAQQALRKQLKDASKRIRFEAACLLSEFRDAAALPELKAALDRFSVKNKQHGPAYYVMARKLLASFERITGKNFGEIPPNPLFLPDQRDLPQIRQRYDALLQTWAAWWAWQPEARKQQSARDRAISKTKPRNRVRAAGSVNQRLRGFDLTKALHTTRASELPDLWEQRPEGSGSYEIRKDVVRSYMGLDGAVYYVPAKKQFYVQTDPLGSSTRTFYGPFDGNPQDILNLSASNARVIHADPSGGK